MSYHILVVDDDISIREALERGFRLEGFPVSSVANGEAALREVEENIPGLIILDVNMPGMNGIQVTRYLRSINVDIPICVLSAKDEVADRISGLEAGADDYMVKPFAFEELIARVRALLRRHKVISTDTINVGELNVDPQRRVVSYFDRELTLTKKEFDLLYVLANNADVVLSRYQLLVHVWGYAFEVVTNELAVFFGYLRKKMEENGQPRILETIRGVGFMLRK